MSPDELPSPPIVRMTKFVKVCPLSTDDARPGIECITGTKLATQNFYCDFRGDNGQVYCSYSLRDTPKEAKADLVAFYRTHLLNGLCCLFKDLRYIVFVVLRNLLLALLVRTKGAR